MAKPSFPSSSSLPLLYFIYCVSDKEKLAKPFGSHSPSRARACGTRVTSTPPDVLFFSFTDFIPKVSNWKKVLERLVDYYEVHLEQRLSGFTMPDVTKIGERTNISKFVVVDCRESFSNPLLPTALRSTVKVCTPFLHRHNCVFFRLFLQFYDSCLSCLVVIVVSFILVV